MDPKWRRKPDASGQQANRTAGNNLLGLLCVWASCCTLDTARLANDPAKSLSSRRRNISLPNSRQKSLPPRASPDARKQAWHNSMMYLVFGILWKLGYDLHRRSVTVMAGVLVQLQLPCGLYPLHKARRTYLHVEGQSAARVIAHMDTNGEGNLMPPDNKLTEPLATISWGFSAFGHLVAPVDTARLANDPAKLLGCGRRNISLRNSRQKSLPPRASPDARKQAWHNSMMYLVFGVLWKLGYDLHRRSVTVMAGVLVQLQLPCCLYPSTKRGGPIFM